MASKVNSRLKRDKSRSGKPYGRSNQSIFRKVASKVRDIFVPSWLLNNVPSWGSSDDAESVPAAASVENEVLEDDVDPIQSTAPRPAKRLKYDGDITESADVQTTTQTGTWFPSARISDRLSEREENSASQVASNCELEKKETQLIVNGDDHSENSEGTASTSGCSSLISSHVDKPDRHSSARLNETVLKSLHEGLKGKISSRLRKDAAVSTENSLNSSTCNQSGAASDLSLWSRDSHFSPRNALKLQAAAYQNSRPSFSLPSFGGPSAANSSLPSTSKVSSPFYEGRTTYGGAAAYRRAQLSTLPYQSSKTLRSKITVKQTNPSDNFECMSSAAQRILKTLEKMSTPLTDAKKIPNIKSPADISASFSPASHRLNSHMPLPRRITLSTPYTKGPPVSTITPASRLNLLRNFSKASKHSKMEIPVHNHSSLTLDTAAPSPAPELESKKSGGGGGGKIRARINQHLHQSSKPDDEKEMPEEVHLPNIPLPITELPSINFASVNKPKVPENEPVENGRMSEPEESVSFTFANPIEHLPPQTAIQTQNTITGPSFTFSSPVVVKNTTTTSASTKLSASKETIQKKTDEPKETELYTGSVNDFLKTLRENNQKTVEKSNSGTGAESKKCSNTYKADKELLEPVETGFGDKFKPQTGSWECSSCLLRNKPEDTKCVACEASKPGHVDQSKTTSLGAIFKPAPGTWECPICFIRNAEDCTKCQACETVKPGSFTPAESQSISRENNMQFKRSEPELVKSQQAFQGFTVSTAGTWECDTCMVRSPMDKVKCIACETPRIPSENTGSKTSSGFKFGSVTNPAPPATFKFGSLVVNPVATTSSGFKFSAPTDASKPQDSVKFGAATFSTPTSDAFKLNSSPPVTSTNSEGFKFGIPASDVPIKSSEGLFKFGSATKPSTESVPDSNSSTTAPFSFGSLNSNQSKSADHSNPNSAETSEVKTQKTETVIISQPSVLTSVAEPVQLPEPSALFPTSISSSSANISKAPCTTTASSGLTSGGFVFGSTHSTLPQSATTFQFGNNVDDIKTSSSATSNAQTLTVATSSTSTSSISSSSPFTFGSQPNKQFAPTETGAISQPVEDSHAMAQEQQSAPEVSSTRTLGFPPTSVQSQPMNFIFGVSNASAPTSSASLFKFGTAATTTSSAADSAPKSTTLCTFGVSSSTAVKDSKPGFSFGNTTEEKPQTLPQSQFAFNAFKQDASNPATTSASTAPSPFKFGSTVQPAPVSTGGFVFGTQKSDVSQTAPSPFSFGPGTVAKPLNNPSFGVFSQNPPTTTASVPSFSFGMATSNTTPVSGGFNVPNSNPSSLFTFGAKTTQAVAPSPVNATGPLANPNPVFGAPANQSVFNTTASMPAFGKPPEPKQDTSGGFSFGNSVTSSAPVFRFGSTQDGPQEKRHAAGPAPSGGFNFSMSPQQNAMGSVGFNPHTPPSFNFGAMPTSSPFFQFNASTDSTSGQSSSTRKIRKAVRRGLRKTD